MYNKTKTNNRISIVTMNATSGVFSFDLDDVLFIHSNQMGSHPNRLCETTIGFRNGCEKTFMLNVDQIREIALCWEDMQ